MKISILLACRKQDNPNSNLQRLLTSLADNCVDLSNFEVLIKFDDDDSKLEPYTSYLLPAGFNVKSIVTPRAAGFTDLHKAYNDLLVIASPESEMFWVLSDDAEIKVSGWDRVLLDLTMPLAGKIFLVNTTTVLDMSRTYPITAIEGSDAYSVFSRRWVGIMGGFGYVWATDGMSSLVCHIMETQFGVKAADYRLFADVKPLRHCEPEGSLTVEFETERRIARDNMIGTLLSFQIQSLLHIKAECLADAIIKGK